MLVIPFVATALMPVMFVAWFMAWPVADALKLGPRPVLYPVLAAPRRDDAERKVA